MDVNSPIFPIYYQSLKLSTKLVPGSWFNRFWFRYLHFKNKAKGRRLNLKTPTTFSDKIVWLKLFHEIDRPEVLVDKLLVRRHVESILGDGHLIPLIGAWQHADEINFDELPNRFVAKASHGSGWNIVCEDKTKLDLQRTRKTLNKWIGLNYYYFGREKPYRNCPPRIVIEKHLSDIADTDIKDFKFYCFHGQPKFVQIDVDRFSNHRQAFYDMDWQQHRFHQLYPRFEEALDRPPQFEQMINMAKRLAADLPFARIDLFNHGGQLFFGEITFHPHGGFAPFFPDEYDHLLGKEIQLPMTKGQST